MDTINFNNNYYNNDRVDGIEKVTGRAKYTADHRIENVVYAVFVTSTIARGAIKNMNLAKAKNAPGVIDIIYYQNCPHIPGYKPYAKDPDKKGFEWRGLKVFSNNLVYHYGQPIALVIADTWEKAVYAASLVKAVYIEETFETNFDVLRKDEKKLKNISSYTRGDADAYKNAAYIVEGEYNIPIETHNPMEMHATIAIWDADHKLTVYDKSQGPRGTQLELARTFALEEKNVRVITEFVGGAFGNALRSWPNVIAACIAAKMVKRPVKLLLNRSQMFTMVGYRPQSWQKINIGADKDGKLTGITHYAVSNTSRYEEFREGIVNASQFLYDCPHVNTSYKILPLDLNTPTWMRGPGEASGAFALESALDELSYKLKMDPVELRMKNYATIHPVSKLPWSSKFLKECYNAGKEKIGWHNRPMVPRSLQENGMLVGYGMAGGVFGASRGAATVKAILMKDGNLILQSAVSDMGPGTATSMVIIAASSLQMQASKIKFMLGDTDYPPGPTQGGSTTTSTLGAAISLVCTALKETLKDLAITHITLFKNYSKEELEVKDETIISKKDNSKNISFAELLQATGKTEIEIIKESGRATAETQKYAMNSFSAHFVKVHVNPNNGIIQLKQIIATGDGGKIINEKTARSQMIGGAVGGIGMALTEELLIDHTNGSYINNNFGAYHVPLHTDVPEIETWFPDLPDPIINEMGSKGVGEIALVGFAPALANAVYNATGKRIRNLPITAEKVMG